jgi:hypothetical protein
MPKGDLLNVSSHKFLKLFESRSSIEHFSLDGTVNLYDGRDVSGLGHELPLPVEMLADSGHVVYQGCGVGSPLV